MRLLAALVGTLATTVAGCGDEDADEPRGAGQGSPEDRPASPAHPEQPAEEHPPADADGGGSLPAAVV